MTSLQIKYFLHLCETKSFSKTARLLYVAQPAISKQIAALEKEIGFSLFIRTNRGVLLTEAGEEMYRLFGKFEAEYQKLQEKLASDHEKKQPRLTIGILEGMNLKELEKVFEELKNSYPDLQIRPVRLDNIRMIKRLSEGELDLIITFDHALEKRNGIRQENLMEDESIFIAAKSNPIAKKRKSLTLSDLNGQIFCEMEPREGNPEEDYLRKLLKELKITPKGYLIVENVASGMETVEINHAIGLVDEKISLMDPDKYLFLKTGYSQKIVAATRVENENPYAEEFVRLLKGFCEEESSLQEKA